MKIIVPTTSPIVIEGPLFYQESGSCFNTLRLKKKLTREFQELKNAENKVFYRIELWRRPDDLKQRMKEIIEKRQALPLLLFFYADK